MAYKLGITGGIGSGKSGLSSFLRVMGIPVYDCDREARRLMISNPAIRQGLETLVGTDVYLPDNTLNRRLLADFMFGHAERVKAVNTLVHPVVRDDFRQWTASSKASLVAVESAILFEAGMRDDVDAVALVYTPLAERLERTIARDRATEEAVRARLASQMSDEEKLPLVDFIIYNAETDAIIPQTLEILDRILTISENAMNHTQNRDS